MPKFILPNGTKAPDAELIDGIDSTLLAKESFKTIAVLANNLNPIGSIVADSSSDTLTLQEGSNINFTVDTNNDSIVINSTIPVATSSIVGGVKSGTDITVDGSGNVSVVDNSHNHDASNINAGVLNANRLDKTMGAYQIDPSLPYASGTFHTTLSDPTLGALALNKENYAFDGMQFKIPTSIEYTSDGTNWSAYTNAEKDNIKAVWSGRYQSGNSMTIKSPLNNSDVTITSVRFTWHVGSYANCYYYLKYLYIYYSTSGHTANIKIQKSQDGIVWTDVTVTTNTSGWPGHTFIPHSSIPWGPTVGSGHYPYVRMIYNPNWTGNQTYNHIIYAIRWFGTYPAGGGTQLYTWDFDRNVNFYGKLSTTGQLESTASIGIAPLAITSTTKVANLNADRVDDCHVNDSGNTTSDLWTANKINSQLSNKVNKTGDNMDYLTIGNRFKITYNSTDDCLEFVII